MDTEKPHRSTSSNNNNNSSSSTSELFVCFTSRLSSSSMKLSSKSILSPSRNRDQPQISLSSSVSRRLKSNGSMKGGQASPMFPTTVGKRRGCGFENPEPSSPKVTCIGQVRVKTKKQGKKMRSRSKRRGEASFRRGENSNPDLTRQNSQSFQYQNHQSLQQQECLKHRNQRWVHLPLTICEALREFSCFFPCRSSCMSSEREKEDKSVGGLEGEGRGGSSGGHGREGSCGFARWLVALQDGDGKGRGIQLVMEHEEEMEMEMEEEDGREKGERSHSQRRHIFEDLDIDVVEGGKEEEEVGGEEEEKGRVSICIPPKNALLLMRCRSDPVKMAALANRFWESPLQKDQDEVENEEGQEEDSGDEEEEQEEDEGDKDNQHIEMEQVEEELVAESETQDSICERETQQACVVDQEKAEEEEGKPDMKESYEIESRTKQEIPEAAMEDKDEEENGNAIDHKVETFSCVLVGEASADLEKPEMEETREGDAEEKESKEKENDESAELSSSPEMFVASEPENDEAEAEAAITAEGSTEEEGEKGTSAETEQGKTGPPESTERENGSKEEERVKERETLPECLLLMMCEPKLSMEVSKETWVCSTDFIRWLPERPTGKPAGAGGGGEKRVTVDSSSSSTKTKPKQKPRQPLMQPPRSSCSFPATGGGAGMSMATMIEQKLAGSSKSQNGYEPFVLKRCKSEPMRSATKLTPEACFWNNRKLEPHPPPASLGVGAPAGVGF